MNTRELDELREVALSIVHDLTMAIRHAEERLRVGDPRRTLLTKYVRKRLISAAREAQKLAAVAAEQRRDWESK